MSDSPPRPQAFSIRAAQRVWLHDDGTPIFGPGTLQLLQLVVETGSLHRAATQMRMSYTKAWRIVHEAEDHLGFPLLTRRTGGPSGGGSSLTPVGLEFLARFRAVLDETRAALDDSFRRHFGDWGDSSN